MNKVCFFSHGFKTNLIKRLEKACYFAVHKERLKKENDYDKINFDFYKGVKRWKKADMHR